MHFSDAEQIDAIANSIITNIGTYECEKELSEKQKKELYRLVKQPMQTLLEYTSEHPTLETECVSKIHELKGAIDSMHEKGADLKSRRLVLKIAVDLDQLAA